MSTGVVNGYITHIPSSGADTITSDSGASVSLLDITRVEAGSESANVIHQNLNGTSSLVLLGDRPQTGTLTLLFDNDADMAAARDLLRTPSTFRLECPARPVVSMSFIRTGSMSPVMHDEIRHVWELQIGYQEV